MSGSAFVAPTTIKTSNYTALAGDLVPVDTTAGAVTVTLPSPATDEAAIAVKLVKGSNNVTVAAGGSDTFNDSGTGTLTISTLNQALVMQYAAPIGVWYVVSGDVAGGGGGSFLPLSGGTMTGWLAPATAALTQSGGSVAVNAALGNVFTLTLTASGWTISNPSNPVNGQHIIFELSQDSTGGRTVNWGTAYSFGVGGPPSLSTTGNALDLLGFVYNSTLSAWVYAGSGAGTYRPFQFPVAAYGAKGDGQVANDLTITSGSATVTSATIYADTNCVGKSIMINGGSGTTAAPLITTIIARGPTANQITLNTNAGATVSASPFAQAFWASDDTSAINAAVTAAGAYATANDYYAEVIFDAKFYGLASGPTQSTSPQFNAQIPLPYPNVNGTTQKLVIKLTGAGSNNHFQYWESTIPNLSGTCLVSMVQPPHTVSGTFGNQSVIGGPSAYGAFTGDFANTKAVIDGICVVSPIITDGYAYDLRYVSSADVYRSSAQVFASVLGNAPALGASLLSNTTFQNANGVALAMPIIGNNADCDVDSFVAEGYTLGAKVSDTFNARRLGLFYCATGLQPNLGDAALSNKAGQMTILDLIIGSANNAISVPTGTGGVLPVYFNLTTETIGTDHLNDPNNQVVGVIHWNDTTATTPTVAGGANVKFVNDRTAIGHVTSPTFTLGTALLNPFWRDTFVVVSGGTVTGISIDGTSTGLTSGTFMWPANKTMTISGSVLPTVTCWTI